MATLKSGEIVRCPKCHVEQDEGLVDNYVIPGEVGEASRAQDTCYECGAEFSVERLKDGTFVVELEND